MTQPERVADLDGVVDALVVRVDDGTGATVVCPAGEIDIATCSVLDECLSEVDGHLVVDLAAVLFMDSSGFSVLNAHRIRLEETGGTFRMRGATPAVARVFEVLGLEDWLDR